MPQILHQQKWANETISNLQKVHLPKPYFICGQGGQQEGRPSWSEVTGTVKLTNNGVIPLTPKSLPSSFSKINEVSSGPGMNIVSSPPLLERMASITVLRFLPHPMADNLPFETINPY